MICETREYLEDIIATMSQRCFRPVISNDLDKSIPKPELRKEKQEEITPNSISKGLDASEQVLLKSLSFGGIVESHQGKASRPTPKEKIQDGHNSTRQNHVSSNFGEFLEGPQTTRQTLMGDFIEITGGKHNAKTMYMK